VGEIEQVPPMFSALHHEGRRLYELAREGAEVERKPRRVTVHAITLEDLELPELTIRVRCGKGTYVRTLAADLGEVLGAGGVLAHLVRSRVGPYRLEDAVSWATLRDARDGAALWPALLPLDSALAAFPALVLDAPQTRAFLHRPAAAAAAHVPAPPRVLAPGRGAAAPGPTPGAAARRRRRGGAARRGRRPVRARPPGANSPC